MWTDKGLPMRSLPLCLSLAFLSWGAFADSICDTEVISDQVVSVEDSMKGGAHVEVLQVYRAANLTTCLYDCCDEKYGKCTLIGFNNAGKKAMNCYHFICSPLNLCQYLNSTGTDSVRIKSNMKETFIGNSTDISEVNNNNASSHMTKNSEQEIRSISARKGVILLDNSYSSVDSTGSVSARKGVSYSEEDLNHITGDGTYSKPRKGVSLESDNEENFGLKKDNTTVKARKGVDSTFLEEIPPLSSEDAMNTSDSENSMLVLHTFVEENTTQNSNEVMFKLNSTHQDVESNITFDAQSLNDKEMDKIMPASLTFRTGIVEAKSSQDFTITTMSNKNLQMANSSVAFTDTFKDSQTSLNKQQASSISPETNNIISQKLQESKEASLFPHRFSSPIAHLVSSETFNFTSVTVKTKELRRNDDIEEFKMSSVFLVVALVMGLVLLFVVLGVVSKHVHDIWMRRHYHRMDFLIDGMYDSYA